MIEKDEPQDLAALVVPLLGSLRGVEDPWEPCRLTGVEPAVGERRRLHGDDLGIRRRDQLHRWPDPDSLGAGPARRAG